MNLTFYREPDMYWGLGAYGRKKKLTAAKSALVEVRNPDNHSEDTTSEWKKSDYTMKDWLKHLQDIFDIPQIEDIWFKENSSEFDIGDIKEALGNATEFYIENTGCMIFSQMILEKFFPIESLTINTRNFRDSKIPPSLLIQNHTYLSIYKTGENVVPITLNQLLLINSKDINVESLQITSKQINEFIKLWQQGSNPRMEHLRFKYYNIEEDDVMKGIKHEVIPYNQRRLFQSTGLAEPYEIDGGFDFYSMNGVKATIEFNWDWYSFYFDMFVWFDHCVVES
ncbi:hypothetical protein CAEBREN_02721 [Caenorhabditis brenneri]|uniref:Sdz-33 F-box domain-containing protein n=1 Tax=Caenorhabditis brenneri TaxID=135651 RepID=G0N0C9_CAEBE|nr:hypothetical protein CAEBREN_02721 [Caenorhabditis brenneri]